MTKVKIEFDIGDITEFIDSETMQDLIIDKIREWANGWFRDGLAGYAKEHLYHQMARYADSFLLSNPELKQTMDDNFRDMIKESQSFAYYTFSNPVDYDRSTIRPGYAMIQNICKDPEVIKTVREKIISVANEKFERMDASAFYSEMGYSITHLIEDMFVKKENK